MASASATIPDGYKQTEVGVIPEDWEITSLIDIVDPTRGIRYGIVQPGKYDMNGSLMIRGQDYSKGWVSASEMFRVSPAIEVPYRNSRVKTDDILITIVGASTGLVTTVPDWLDGANLTQTTARICINSSRATSIYCFYSLSSRIGKVQVENYLKGGAQPGLNCGDIEKFVIPLPPTTVEQKAISSTLSVTDNLISTLEKLIEKKRGIKQATIQNLLTGNNRLTGFTDEWVKSNLIDIVKIEKGKQLKKSDVSEYGLFPHYNGGVEPSNYTNIWNATENHIIISEGGNSCGYVQFVKQKFWTGGHCYLLSKSKINNNFLFWALKSVQSKIMGLRVGSGLPNVQKSALMDFQIVHPRSVKEQEAIAEILSDMDAEISALEQRLEKTKKIHQGMMQQLLTGRIRLVDPSTPEEASA